MDPKVTMEQSCLQDCAVGFFHFCDFGRLRSGRHFLNNLDDLVSVGESHGCQLGVDEGAIDVDLKGGSPPDGTGDVRMGNLLANGFSNFHIAVPVPSGAAVLDLHFGLLRRRGHLGDVFLQVGL